MTYLELIAAISAAEGQHGLRNLDPVSRGILHTIASANLVGVNVHMRDLKRIATFPTVKSHLEQLIDAGWIEKTEDIDDKRGKLLGITPKTRLVLDEISNTLNGSPAHIKKVSCDTCIAKIRELAFLEFQRKFKDLERDLTSVT